jgi:hypothetical protein
LDRDSGKPIILLYKTVGILCSFKHVHALATRRRQKCEHGNRMSCRRAAGRRQSYRKTLYQRMRGDIPQVFTTSPCNEVSVLTIASTQQSENGADISRLSSGTFLTWLRYLSPKKTRSRPCLLGPFDFFLFKITDELESIFASVLKRLLQRFA